MPDLVNDEAGRTDEAGEHGSRLLRPPGSGELVAELRRLDEIGFQTVLAAFVAESLSQVRFARSSWANEGQVPVGVDESEGPDALELLQVGEALAPEHTEVEVLKGLGDLLREPAHAQDGLGRGLFLLFPEVFKEYRHAVQRILGKALLQGELRQLRGGKVQLEDAAAMVDGSAEGFSHPTTPPWRS